MSERLPADASLAITPPALLSGAAAGAVVPPTAPLGGADVPAADSGRSEGSGARATVPESTGRWRSLRMRIVIAFVSVLAVAVLGSVLITHVLLVQRADGRIQAHLEQEVEELRVLASGLDPRSGQPFAGDVERLFSVFLQQHIPVDGGVFISFVDGQPFLRSGEGPYRLDLDPELSARWPAVRTSERGRVDTPAGEVDYVAVPLTGDEQHLGTFVVAVFRGMELAAVGEVTRTVLVAGLLVLLLGCLMAWRLGGRIVRPVRALTETARSISETDLDGRIEVGSRDELGTLARTFNRMLDRLAEAFETQRRFVDDAGHELKTPLTAVRGHLELLNEGGQEEHDRTVELVLDEVDRMTRITNDMLLLAKAEQPDFLRLHEVEVATLLRDVVSKAAPLGERAWRLVEPTDGARTSVIADAQRLTQAMLQLAQNAVAHTRVGGVIEIGSRTDDAAVRLWVRDDGEGIPPGELGPIFERFHRVSGSTRRSDGAGLGLSIVRAIAEAHGGEIEVTSRPRAGACFTLVIPFDGGAT